MNDILFENILQIIPEQTVIAIYEESGLAYETYGNCKLRASKLVHYLFIN